MATKKRTKKKTARSSRPKAAKRARPAKRAARVAKRVKPIPDGYRVVTPAFRTAGCARAIDFLKTALGARVRDRYDAPDGTVMHAEVQIGDSIVMCGEAGPPGPFGPFPLFAMIYVKDVDRVFRKAVAGGAVVVRELKDQFYGDRNGTVRDAWGNEWTISTHKEDVSHRENLRRMTQMAGS
jgi:PhnB protein